ncbi:MAG: Copper-sensitive operon repressor [Actinomycetota bacterium]|jgi:DNA-binding FrmR family transcriptional regulator
MAKKISAPALKDVEQLATVITRLKRANGQMNAVIRMLEEGRNCEEVVTQIAAVNKAINTAAFTLISSSLKECIAEGKQSSSEVTEKLQKLFLSLA